ncbi:hypothetical protein [Campylobacter troglodytis]|uniref:hypothetical protein n=1 Tax=Campylobacter troglodytis TaxID=654363 RepID=UPI00163BF851|nr:hypothetical protein [Campylobacter troglodytis]
MAAKKRQKGRQYGDKKRQNTTQAITKGDKSGGKKGDKKRQNSSTNKAQIAF